MIEYFKLINNLIHYVEATTYLWKICYQLLWILITAIEIKDGCVTDDTFSFEAPQPPLSSLLTCVCLIIG